MTQFRRICWFVVLLVAPLLLATRAAAQIHVTPNVAPTPPGQLIVVNNGPGDQTDPHVSGDLVSYSNSVSFQFTIRYFNLATGVDAAVPNNGTMDFLSDVRGTVIAFTRVSSNSSAIFQFDTSNPSAPPVEVNPMPGAARQAAQIGDQTIAWQDSSAGTSSAIVAFDRQSATATRLNNDSTLNQSPGISPDGKVIVWVKCATLFSPCSTWKAILSNGTWTAQQLVSQVGGNQSHPDTDGMIIAYSADPGSGDQLVWQPVGGGTEQVLNFGGSASRPSVSGGLITFAGLKAGGAGQDIYVYHVPTNTLYNVTGDLANAGLYPSSLSNQLQLNDTSVTPDGKVRVVWHVLQADFNIYAYTFNLIGATISDLTGLVNSFNLPSGTANSLLSKLGDAQASLAAGDLTGACNGLNAFINEVQAQSGKSITVDQANELIALANGAKASLGCP